MIAFLSPAPPCRVRHSKPRSLTHRPSPAPRLAKRARTRSVPAACTPPPDGDAGPLGGLRAQLTHRLLAGFEPSAELAAILTAYFVQGALGLSRLAVSFFLKDALALSPAETSALLGAGILPWLIKPVYGFLTDSVPIAGFRRRPYLVAAGALGAISWLALATVVDSAPTALAATLGASASVAISDVVADSLVVARVRGLPEERSAALQSLCWGTSAFGGLLSAYFSGSLLASLGARPIFALTAVLPAATAVLATLIAEPRVDTGPMKAVATLAKERASSLWRALNNPAVLLPAGFIFLWQATPSPDSALFYFQTDVLGFGPEFLGRVRLAASAAALAGVWTFNTFLTRVSLKRVILFSTLASVPLSLVQVLLVTRANVALGISDQAFALVDSTVLAVLGQIAFMPTLVLAARLCPPGVEGTLFAALMSVYNASGAVSSELGALLTSALKVTPDHFDNLATLIVLCSLSYMLPLPLLGLMDRAPPTESPGEQQDSIGSAEVEAAVQQLPVSTEPAAVVRADDKSE